MHLFLTHRLIAESSLLGMGLDALGGLYLTYDLLGGQHGPLRTIARATSYAVLFLIGYAGQLGLSLSTVTASAMMGITRSLEVRGKRKEEIRTAPSLGRVIRFGILRGLVLGLAGLSVGGPKFAVIFGPCAAIALGATYSIDGASGPDDGPPGKPHISKRNMIASALRAVGICIAGIVAGLISSEGAHPLILGLRLGLAAGTVSALIGLFGPSIEWQIENMAQRRLGMIGLCMIFAGILLQSIQYWVVVYPVPIR